MKIAQLIREEAARFACFYGRQPDSVFIGHDQAAELDVMIEELKAFGYLIQTSTNPRQRARFDGMAVYRVDAQTHISFGLEQPSPCG